MRGWWLFVEEEGEGKEDGRRTKQKLKRCDYGRYMYDLFSVEC